MPISDIIVQQCAIIYSGKDLGKVLEGKGFAEMVDRVDIVVVAAVVGIVVEFVGMAMCTKAFDNREQDPVEREEE